MPAVKNSVHPHVESLLDNVVWSALTGPQAHLAVGGPAAWRYPADIAPFCAVRDLSSDSMDALARLTVGDDHVTLFADEVPELVQAFELVKCATVLQMVLKSDTRTRLDPRLVSLGRAGDQEMFDLAAETKPGPFRRRTAELGVFFGLRIQGTLAAMAGERMRVEGATEVSAVCTRDAYRGRGYAALLVEGVANVIRHRGETPFLHVFESNRPAVSLYERLGFSVRKTHRVVGAKKLENKWPHVQQDGLNLFLTLPPEEAVKAHPELAPAHASLEAVRRRLTTSACLSRSSSL